MTNKPKTTLLDFAIMGLLQSRPLSGYGIRKEFEESALGNYSSSPGTIYPALKRLEKLGYVEKKYSTSSKSPFSLTDDGRIALRRWLELSVTKEDVVKRIPELLLRFAFMDPSVSNPKKLIFLKDFQKLLDKNIKELKAYYLLECEKMPLTGKLAFEHGMMTYKTTLQWCKKAIKTIKNQ